MSSKLQKKERICMDVNYVFKNKINFQKIGFQIVEIALPKIIFPARIGRINIE